MGKAFRNALAAFAAWADTISAQAPCENWTDPHSTRSEAVLETEVLHNTVYSGDRPFSSIEYRWPNTKVALRNNLVSLSILERDDAQGFLEGNREKRGASGAPAMIGFGGNDPGQTLHRADGRNAGPAE